MVHISDLCVTGEERRDFLPSSSHCEETVVVAVLHVLMDRVAAASVTSFAMLPLQHSLCTANRRSTTIAVGLLRLQWTLSYLLYMDECVANVMLLQVSYY